MLHLFKYLKKKDYFNIFIVLVLIVFQVYLELKMPDYTKELTVLVQVGTDSMKEVLKNGGLMLLCALGSLVCAIVCSYFISHLSSSFSKTLREELFNKIVDFSSEEMNKFSTASLITRTTNDVVQVQNFMSMGIQMLLKAPIMAIWAILKISKTDVRWTYATIICVAVIVVCIGILVSICLPKFKQIQKMTDELNDITRENVSGVRVIRAFNANNYQENKFEAVNEKITKTNLFTNKAMGFLSPVMNICMNGLTLAIYFIGAVIINEVKVDNSMNFIIERTNAIANMTAFTSYAMQIVMSFMMLIMIFIILPRVIISANRIWEVLNTKKTILDGNNDFSLQEKGTVEFKNVSFSYGDGSEVIKNINFKVNEGETLAIIGATGSGKTTLINLISRFFDVNEGEVLVDGVNVKEYRLEELRDKISLATQKASLFKGTIKDNITYGATDIAKEKIDLAISIAQADFINNLEKGIDSEVAQGGTNFSGGQKQRISIARALYKTSEIVIFDDTFSALDYKTDMLVRKAIKENLIDKTVIIIAQRIGTIMNADKIIVLDEGEIVGMGKHSELLKTCKVYQEIALSQLSKEEL